MVNPDSGPGGGRPRGRSGVSGRRKERTGTEPVTARSALRMRLVLSVLFVPLFLVGTVVFWYWAEQSGPRSAPTGDSLRVLTVICAALALFALVDLLVVLRRRRRERASR